MPPQTMHAGSGLIPTLITVAIVALVLAIRVRGMRRARRLNPATLWIIPIIYLLAAASFLFRFPPYGLQWLGIAAALAVGAALGWRRGMLMRISIDPETGTLIQQSSPAAFLFILVLLAVRVGLRYEANSLGFDLAFVTDLLMVFALGLFTASRIEMWLRAKRLLADRSA